MADMNKRYPMFDLCKEYPNKYLCVRNYDDTTQEADFVSAYGSESLLAARIAFKDAEFFYSTSNGGYAPLVSDFIGRGYTWDEMGKTFKGQRVYVTTEGNGDYNNLTFIITGHCNLKDKAEFDRLMIRNNAFTSHYNIVPPKKIYYSIIK